MATEKLLCLFFFSFLTHPTEIYRPNYVRTGGDYLSAPRSFCFPDRENFTEKTARGRRSWSADGIALQTHLASPREHEHFGVKHCPLPLRDDGGPEGGNSANMAAPPTSSPPPRTIETCLERPRFRWRRGAVPLPAAAEEEAMVEEGGGGAMSFLKRFPPPAEGVRHQQPDTEAVLAGRSLGAGTLYIAER